MKLNYIAGLLVFFGVLTFLSGQARAEYTIGIDDALQITFWQQPTLNQAVVVNSEGKITLSVTGEITAAGLTPSALSRKIIEQVSRFNRDVSQATVVVTAYNSQTVFVEGAVVAPGRFSREVIPDLWTIIKEMGGVTPTGDLRNVRVIRGGTTDPGKIIAVDVLSAVSNRDLSVLPQIYPHDIIQVSATISGTPGEPIPAAATAARNRIYILGAVAKPAIYTLEPGMDLFNALAQAGGTLPTANLKTVRIITKSGDYSNVYTINLARMMKEGTPARYILQPEDAVFIEQGSSGIAGTLASIGNLASFASTLTSTVLLIDRLKTGN